MPPPAITWTLRSPDPALVARLARQHGLPELVASLLVARGHADPDAVGAHLRASPMGLHAPELLPGMEAATDRLTHAVRTGETILVHGDYDVDGVTGTTLLMRLLRVLGARAEWHIPNRLVHGYSFGPHSVERARATGASVLISVDNGTSAFETIAELKAAGVDTVVTDHHEPPRPHPELGPLPPAVAIVNPKLADSTYPWRELCGGAVAFKLAWGLCQALSGEGTKSGSSLVRGARVRQELKAFLEEAMAYVAIATVCDVVPLVDENRIFARWGLKALATTENPGLRALLEVAGLAGRTLTAEDVAFQIGPRINASGRLGSAKRAVQCLLARDAESARTFARELDELNRERKRIEVEVLELARREAERFHDPHHHPVLVLAGQGWHQGVVGIVAARLCEELHRPAIVIGLDGDTGRGSARTVDGFNVLEAMHGGAAHMLRYGGHEQAAGLEIEADRVESLRKAICERAREIVRGERPGRCLRIDFDLPLGTLDGALMRALDRLEPFGAGNEQPVLLARDVRLASPPRQVGADGSHLILQVRRGAASFKALAFGMAHRLDELRMGAPLHLVHSPRWNTFRGQTNLELLVHDFRTGELGELAREAPIEASAAVS